MNTPVQKASAPDSIHLASLSREAYVPIRDLAETREWSPIHAWVDTAEYLLLIERLKREPDSEELFPKGKWATIQRIQAILEEAWPL